jgi:dTMP kinase
VFITLEGIDRSGKTTQARLLAEKLGEDTLLVREPGGTPAGERVRELLKDPGVEITPMAELMLFSAARAQLVTEVIRPALEQGRRVVCDRFADSSVVYQGAGRGLGTELAEKLCRDVTQGLEPELTVLIRVAPEVAAEREGDADRFEEEGIELQRRVAAAYDEIAEAYPGRVVAVDGEGRVEEVHERVMAVVRERTWA